MARKIEELPVYQRAVEFWIATTAILERPALRRDCRLWAQINDANDSILSNMKEGFELSTDNAFANLLGSAKGSCAEVVLRTEQAFRKRYLTREEYEERRQMGEEVQRMLGGFIKYLRRSAFRDRGSFTSKHRPPSKPNE
jgi:four helix bundle protein